MTNKQVQPGDTVYVTRNALSRRKNQIEEYTVRQQHGGSVSVDCAWTNTLTFSGDEWHVTPEDAKKDVCRQIEARRAALRKQIQRLDELEVKVTSIESNAEPQRWIVVLQYEDGTSCARPTSRYEAIKIRERKNAEVVKMFKNWLINSRVAYNYEYKVEYVGRYAFFTTRDPRLPDAIKECVLVKELTHDRPLELLTVEEAIGGAG